MTGSEAVRLRLLGDPAVDGSGEDASGIVSQPKRLALLAYLAVQGGFVRRDVLAEMFWPDSDADRARRALNQATHILRRCLGRSVIRSRGTEELGISPDHAWIDVRSFEAAIAGERWAEAVELHRDELLHGLNGDQVSPEFSRWLDGERFRLQRSAAGAAKKMADAAFREGDVAGAIAWARRAVAVRPMDEAMFREYIALLDESGDAALALSEFESFRSRLVGEYDLEPARETVRLIEMIRSRRPEAVPAVRAAGPEIDVGPGFPAAGVAMAGSGPAAAIRQPGSGSKLRRRRARLGLAGVVLAAAVSAVFWLNVPATDARPATVPNRVAVMYFTSMGGETAEVLAAGVTDVLIEHLSSFESLEVLPGSVVERYRGREMNLDSLVPATRASFFVTGAVRQQPEETQLKLELISADGEGLANTLIPFEGPNAGAITEAALLWVVNSLPQLGQAVQAQAIRFGSSDSLAVMWTLEALAAERQAIEYGVTQTFDLVPAELSKADSLLRRAIEREPGWSKPYLYRGRLAATRVQSCFIPFVDCEWESAFDEGIDALTRIIERKDDLSDALEARARLRHLSWIFGAETDTAVLTMAVQDAKDAIELNNMRPGAHRILSGIHMARGHWDGAESHAQWALERDEFGADRGKILADLFKIAFNTHRDSLALYYCDLLRSRPSHMFRIIECDLSLRAWSDVLPADAGEARRLVDSFRSKSKNGEGDFGTNAQAELLIAAVMGRNARGDPEMQESVARLVDRIVAEYPDQDDRHLYAAAVMALMGFAGEANIHLDQYLSSNQAARWHVSSFRWFEDLDFTQRQLDPAESAGVRSGSGTPR